MGVLAVVAALLACKTSEQRTAERIAAMGASAQPTPSAVATASASVRPKSFRRAELSGLAVRLAEVVAKPDKYSTSKDVGQQTVTFELKPFAGLTMASFVGKKGDKMSWRFGLEYMRCDELGELGLEVTELERVEAPIGRGYFNAWYEVDGGMLDGCWVKVHSKSVDEPHLCNVMPGTPPYWKWRNDVPKSKRE